jgi:D-glycero-alpha-D-manno-heptose-7-phosphate kinase
MIISRTPLRISLFGGGTDYREYYNLKKGAVLGATINKYVYVSVNQLSDFFEYKIRVGYSKAELVNSVEEIVHPSVRECLKFHNIEGNLDIHIFADLPAKTGLGSSSSFTVGLLKALYDLKGNLVTKMRIASDAHYIEQIMIGENVGSQDQVHAAYGGLNLIEFSGDTFVTKPVVISKEKFRMLEESLMLFYTTQTRFASDILSEQIEKTKQGSNDEYLDEMYDLVYDAVKVISETDNIKFLEEIGALLNKSWMLKKELSSKVSNATIDDAYQRAMNEGAYGGKVAGAGGGGFLLMLVDPKYQNNVRRALEAFSEVEFNIEQSASKIIYNNSEH